MSNPPNSWEEYDTTGYGGGGYSGGGGKGGGYGYPQQQWGQQQYQQQYGQYPQQYPQYGYQHQHHHHHHHHQQQHQHQHQHQQQQYGYPQQPQSSYQPPHMRQQKQPAPQQQQQQMPPQQQQYTLPQSQQQTPTVGVAASSSTAPSAKTAVPEKRAPRQVNNPNMAGMKFEKGKTITIAKPAPKASDKGDKPAEPQKPKSISLSLGKKEAPKEVKTEEETPAPEPKEVKEEAPAKSPPIKPEEEEPVEVVEEKKEVKKYKRDPRPHLNIVFIGHVDAGKSTITGHMMILSGCVDERTVDKLNREAKSKGMESWAHAYVMDCDEQEREKGKTHQTAAAYFETPNRRYTILDAPGHKSFVPSMIEGAAQADVAVLVISARKNEFETGFDKGGQTREHVLLVKTCGVQFLVIVINKMDDPTVQWSKERYDQIETKLKAYMKEAGFAKEQYEFLPVSGLTGANLRDRIDEKICSWWKGKSLQDILNEVQVPGRDEGARIRFPIQGKYKDEGKVAVHGKLESGTIAVGDKLLVQPSKLTCVVEEIKLDEHQQEAGFAGDLIHLKLRGVDEEDIHAGFVLAHPRDPLPVVNFFHAKVMILPEVKIISEGFSCVMHIHAAKEEVVIDCLLAVLDKKTGTILPGQKFPKFVKGKDMVMMRFEVTQPLTIEEYTTFKKMGRFILRDESKTIGMGMITKALPLDWKPAAKK